MRNLKPLFFTLFILILSSLACTILPENIDPQPALPTASATINAPPTRAIIVPTLTPIPPPAVDPSAVPTESSIDEDEPTATATTIIEPTAVETAAIGSLSIIQPSNGASLVGGQVITVKGTAVGFDKGRIVTTLWLPDSVEPVSAETLVNENWQQTITLPTHFSGSAQLQTVVLSATDEPLATSAINFYIAADEADTSFITMDLPAPNTIFAPGEQLHLLGRATAPPAVFPLIVTLKTNNCQDVASTVTFNIIGSGDW
ncbi:MAG: hypothetical protein KAG66_24435, partial [Methylococcales bacterium]|nr:hypothetical protein [Methylococcales bacterium]